MKLSNILEALVAYEDQIGDIKSFMSKADESTLNLDIKSIVNDNSKVVPGSLFVAIDGTKTDAHSFIAKARQSGAVFVIGSRPSTDKPDLIVNNSRAVVGPASSVFLGEPSRDINIFGITGTNGKTTTTYLLSSIFKHLNQKYCVIGTTGIYLGEQKNESSQTTPDATVLQSLFNELKSDEINNVAMEVSSHALDQMRVLGTTFKSVAFTNLTQDHLDYHENFEKYFEAKALLFDGRYSKNAVVNIDNTFGLNMAEIARNNSMEVTTTSIINPKADICVKVLNSDLSGCDLEIVYSKNGKVISKLNVKTRLIGDFNCENIATAVGLAISGGYQFDDVISALGSSVSIPGRFERVNNQGNNFEVFVDYSHTPDALKRAIEVLKPLANKVIVVFGCGGDRDVAKRPIMGKLASELADLVIVTNDNPRNEDPQKIINDIFSDIGQENQSHVIVMTDRYKAVEYAISKAGDGDCVLIAGKGHETYQQFKDRTEDFSDLKVAEEILTENKK